MMQWTGWIGPALGIVLVTATKVGPPPVILDLGPMQPTPAPTPKEAQRKRLITVITVQNTAAGDSVMSFEATEVADEGQGKSHTLAAKTYQLADDKPELQELRTRITEQVRVLEREMLKYVEKAGPPKEHVPLSPSQQQPGAAQHR